MNIIHTKRRLDELNVNPNNPRVLRDKRFKELKASIEQDPKMLEARPICVSMHPDRLNQIIGGNMRYQAVKSLGWKEVPVAELYDATEEEEKRWMLKDNVHHGDHDWDKLANDFDLDFLKSVGFDEKELDKIIGKQDHSEDDEFDAEKEAEAIKEPICRLGDIWQLGNHRLMCGDSTSPEDVARLMDGKKADMVFTDPPYGIDYQDVKKNHKKIANDDQDVTELVASAISSFPSVPVYLCCNWKCLESMTIAMETIGVEPKACIVWDKKSRIQNLDKFGKRHEFIVYAGPYGGEETVDDDVWEVKRQTLQSHPTAKPIALCEKAIRYSSKEGEKVFDPFCGSGSTLIACENLGRVCYGMEISERYCDVIIKRWEEKVNKKAIKL